MQFNVTPNTYIHHATYLNGETDGMEGSGSVGGMDCCGGMMKRLMEWNVVEGWLLERLVEWTVVEG